LNSSGNVSATMQPPKWTILRVVSGASWNLRRNISPEANTAANAATTTGIVNIS